MGFLLEVILLVILSVVGALLFLPFHGVVKVIKNGLGTGRAIFIGALLVLFGILVWQQLYSRSSGYAREPACFFGWIPAFLVVDIFAAVVWAAIRLTAKADGQDQEDGNNPVASAFAFVTDPKVRHILPFLIIILVGVGGCFLVVWFFASMEF